MEDTGRILERQNAFYQTIRDSLEREAFGKWAVVSNERLVGVYDSNPEASEAVLRAVPGQVCLVKHVGHVVDLSQLLLRVNNATVGHR